MYSVPYNAFPNPYSVLHYSNPGWTGALFPIQYRPDNDIVRKPLHWPPRGSSHRKQYIVQSQSETFRSIGSPRILTGDRVPVRCSCHRRFTLLRFGLLFIFFTVIHPSFRRFVRSSEYRRVVGSAACDCSSGRLSCGVRSPVRGCRCEAAVTRSPV